MKPHQAAVERPSSGGAPRVTSGPKRWPIGARSLGSALVITLFAQVPSVSVVAKYIHHYPALVSTALVIVTALVLAAVIEGLTRSGRLAGLASSWWLTALFLATLALYSLLGYPHEHARQALSSGSTSDQAMQRTWNALIHGRDMYAVHLSGNVPVSPGPLWVILNGPFTLVRAYAWMNPVWLGVTAVALRVWYRRAAAVNLGLAVLVVSPGLARLLAEGHDIPALACAAVLLVALADRLTRDATMAAATGAAVRRVGPGAMVVLGGCAAVLASARIIFLFVPVLLGVLVARRDRRGALGIALIGLLAAGAANGLAAAGVAHYGPLHLFQRAGHRQPVAILAVGVVVAVAIGVLTVLRSTSSGTSWFAWFALCWSVPLLFIGFGELAADPGNLTAWEGANYILAGSIPVMAALLGRLRTADEILPPDAEAVGSRP
ncbi:MAG: hypothetical protein ACR2MN_16585 [Acidimicrobiales bacterium]